MNKTFLLLPSERLIVYEQREIHQDCKVQAQLQNGFKDQVLALPLGNQRVQDFTVSQDGAILGVICSKTVKTYNLPSKLDACLSPVLESVFPKKVQAITFDMDNRPIISDKFGDIYHAKGQNPSYLNSNLGIPTFIKHIHNPKNKKQFIILGDDYCKIKVYNYHNMHEVVGIWYIANSVPIGLFEVDFTTQTDQKSEYASTKEFVMLMKNEDKQNLKHKYQLYQFNIENLEKGDFEGQMIFDGQQESLNSSQYDPVDVVVGNGQYCDSKKLYLLNLKEDHIKIIGFKTELKTNIFVKEFDSTEKLLHPIKDGNWIQGSSLTKAGQVKESQSNKEQLLISYGKYYDWQHKQEESTNGKGTDNSEKQSNKVQPLISLINKKAKGLEGSGVIDFYHLNEKQFIMKWKKEDSSA